jgi:hypothetical protein
MILPSLLLNSREVQLDRKVYPHRPRKEKVVTRFNWAFAVLGSFLALLVGATSSFATNYRDYNPDAFTGWSIVGFAFLAVGLVLVIVIGIMAWKGDAKWTTPVAALIGAATGVGSLVYLQNVDVQWWAVLLGLVCFGGIFILIGFIAYLCGRQGSSNPEPTPAPQAPPAPSAPTPAASPPATVAPVPHPAPAPAPPARPFPPAPAPPAPRHRRRT